MALDLSLTNNNLKTYDFIQKGNLGYSDIKKIAIVINKIKIKNNPYLKILSMSFNQNLKGEGLDLILNVIPKSIKVLAFVECGLSNWGALRIIGYVYKIYLVENSFTVNTQREFKKLKIDRHYLTIISGWPSKEFKEMVKKNYN